ncbi:PLP-dependent aminotransferase family protein [Clostridium sp.]|uniref:MocR-like pyridoxine biosynthesis transcription factor PdxR n=1 Tax=Clostridium sp. TaxID=1506 RepID=UPI00260E8860|nr:PLP-dependent aminotransferase family protein [Clostridium sp.]
MDILNINLNHSSSIPLYIQLYKFIKEEIQKGNLKSKSKLPSKRKLSSYLGISQNTIESAYGQLDAEGYIYSIEKRGYFVSELSEVIDISEKEKRKENRKRESLYKYEFFSSRVDLESFPFSIWKKINKEIMNEENKEFLQIGHSQGDYNLRETIGNYLKYSRGVNTRAENIIIGAGTEYLIQLLINLLGEDKSYGMEEPGYYKIRKILETVNIKAKAIEIDNQGIDIDKLNETNCDVIHITPSHQFPTGIIMPIKRRIDLLKWAKEKKGRYIIEDDYDSEFRFEGRPIPALQSLDYEGKVIYIGTFSKSFIPSMRIAYMVMPDELIKVYRNKFSFYACTVSRQSQQAINKFIEEGYFERHLNRMRNTYKKKREFLVNRLKEDFKDTEIIGTNAGLHLLIKVNNGLSEEELIERAKKVKIRILGISNSYLENKNKESIVFLGYGNLSIKEIDEALNLLKKVWGL